MSEVIEEKLFKDAMKRLEQVDCTDVTSFPVEYSYFVEGLKTLTPEQLKAIGELIKVAEFHQPDNCIIPKADSRGMRGMSAKSPVEIDGGKFARSATPSIELLKQIPGVMDE